jgi:DNA-binding NarL/FixJ family response regulator
MRLLFVDDDPENVEGIARTLREALDVEVVVATTVEAAVLELHRGPIAVVVTDLFIPMGAGLHQAMGPRARRYAEQLEHLGGLVLLDEIDRVEPAPIVLAHTACVDPILLELLGERVYARVRKPAPFEVLLEAVLDALRGPRFP